MEPLASVEYGKKGTAHKDDDLDALFDDILDKKPKKSSKSDSKKKSKKSSSKSKSNFETSESDSPDGKSYMKSKDFSDDLYKSNDVLDISQDMGNQSVGDDSGGLEDSILGGLLPKSKKTGSSVTPKLQSAPLSLDTHVTNNISTGAVTGPGRLNKPTTEDISPPDGGAPQIRPFSAPSYSSTTVATTSESAPQEHTENETGFIPSFLESGRQGRPRR